MYIGDIIMMKKTLGLGLLLLGSQAFAAGMSLGQSGKTGYGAGTRFGAMGGVPQTGLEVFKTVNKKLDLGLSYTSGNVSLKSIKGVKDAESKYDVVYDKVDLGGNMLKLHSRYFPTDAFDSFHITTALGYRQLKTDVKAHEKLLENSRAKFGTTSRSYTAHVGVGNLWKWDSGFQIGATWLEAALPLSGSFKSDLETTFPSDNHEKTYSEVKDLARKLAKSPTYHMEFNIGYQF